MRSRQSDLIRGPSLVAVAVPVVVVDLQQLCHNLQDVVIVFLQQPEIQLPVTESHFEEMGHQGCCLIFRNYWLCRVKNQSLRTILRYLCQARGHLQNQITRMGSELGPFPETFI